MSDSILTSTKKVLGIAEDYNEFDVDIVMHINSALSTLAQIGIGPENGFMINDAEAKWVDLIGDEDHNLNAVKTYVYQKVRLAFDPPTTSYHLTAIKEQIKEAEWRLNVHRESLLYPAGVTVIDGGNVEGEVT